MIEEEYQIIKATLSAFGPDEGVRFAQDTWAKLHQAMSAVVAQPATVQEPVAWVCYGAPGKRDIDFEEADINGLPIGTLLYTTPPAQPATEESSAIHPAVPDHSDELTIAYMSGVHRGKELAAQRQWVGIEEKDMPTDPDPMYDHKYFIAGMVYADNVLMEKNK